MSLSSKNSFWAQKGPFTVFFFCMYRVCRPWSQGFLNFLKCYSEQVTHAQLLIFSTYFHYIIYFWIFFGLSENFSLSPYQNFLKTKKKKHKNVQKSLKVVFNLHATIIFEFYAHFYPKIYILMTLIS